MPIDREHFDATEEFEKIRENIDEIAQRCIELDIPFAMIFGTFSNQQQFGALIKYNGLPSRPIPPVDAAIGAVIAIQEAAKRIRAENQALRTRKRGSIIEKSRPEPVGTLRRFRRAR